MAPYRDGPNAVPRRRVRRSVAVVDETVLRARSRCRVRRHSRKRARDAERQSRRAAGRRAIIPDPGGETVGMQLTPTEVRILGSLIEKESTTPDNYPLSLNALTNACNQTSNRDPVMELERRRGSLGDQRFATAITRSRRSAGRFARHEVPPSRERAHEPRRRVAWRDGVLMLRGPQTPARSGAEPAGSPSSRTSRMSTRCCGSWRRSSSSWSSRVVPGRRRRATPIFSQGPSPPTRERTTRPLRRRAPSVVAIAAVIA